MRRKIYEDPYEEHMPDEFQEILEELLGEILPELEDGVKNLIITKVNQTVSDKYYRRNYYPGFNEEMAKDSLIDHISNVYFSDLFH